MIKIELSFSNIAEAAAALAQLNGSQLSHTVVHEVADPKPEQKRANVVKMPAATQPSAATAATSAPAETAVTAEEVSAAIIKFIPVPEHKASALAVLKGFGVARGKDLQLGDRAPCLAALKAKAAELGLEL